MTLRIPAAAIPLPGSWSIIRQQTRDESSYGGYIVITLSRYAAGEVIVQENDFGETAYLIEQGQVAVSKERDGQTVHLA